LTAKHDVELVIYRGIIDVGHASFDATRKTHASLNVTSKYRRRKTELGVVSHPKCFCFIASLEDSDGRAKNLILGDAHIFGDIGKNVRTNDSAINRTCEDLPSPLVTGRIDEFNHGGELIIIDDRSDQYGIILRIAHRQILHAISELLHELIM